MTFRRGSTSRMGRAATCWCQFTSTASAIPIARARTCSGIRIGHTPDDHGATKDTAVLGGEHYYLLSPKTDTVGRPSQMPAVIGEGLFLTNDDDANALRNDATVEAIARGYAEGIKAYFAKFPPG